jgi:hypothetical protein
VAGENARNFLSDNLMPIVITAIGFSVFVNHDGDPLFHRVAKQCCRRYFPIHKFLTLFRFCFRMIDDFEKDG